MSLILPWYVSPRNLKRGNWAALGLFGLVDVDGFGVE